MRNEVDSKYLKRAVLDRSKFVPLQYILKTQPFGNLTIKCKRGVLIPRIDTEEWCFELIDCLKESLNTPQQKLRVLDVCTGTGCILLLLQDELQPSYRELKGVEFLGIDISKCAIDLARENLAHNSKSPFISFERSDLFQFDKVKETDLIVSNPPYIPQGEMSPHFKKGLEKSVYLYEPHLALKGDTEFYEALVRKVVKPCNAQAFVFELGSWDQVTCVKRLVEEVLPSDWVVGYRNDSSGRIRNVVGWRDKSAFSTLRQMCTDFL